MAKVVLIDFYIANNRGVVSYCLDGTDIENRWYLPGESAPTNDRHSFDVDRIVLHGGPKLIELRTHPKEQGRCYLTINPDFSGGRGKIQVSLPTPNYGPGNSPDEFCCPTKDGVMPRDDDLYSFYLYPNSNHNPKQGWATLGWTDTDSKTDDALPLATWVTGGAPPNFKTIGTPSNKYSEQPDYAMFVPTSDGDKQTTYALCITIIGNANSGGSLLGVETTDIVEQRGKMTTMMPHVPNTGSIEGTWIIGQSYAPTTYANLWNYFCNRYYYAIRQTQGGEAVCFLPELRNDISFGGNGVTFWFEVYFEFDQKNSVSPNSTLRLLTVSPNSTSSAGYSGTIEFPLFKTCLPSPASRTGGLVFDDVTATLYNSPGPITDTSILQKSLQFDYQLLAEAETEGQMELEITKIAQKSQSEALTRTVIDGALRLRFEGTSPTGDKAAIDLTMRDGVTGDFWRCPYGQRQDFFPIGSTILDVRIDGLQLPVPEIGPGAEDAAPTDVYLGRNERPTVVLIPWTQVPAAATASYMLEIAESVESGSDRKFTVELYQSEVLPAAQVSSNASADPQPGDAAGLAREAWVVLEPTPFFAARVSFDKLQVPDLASNGLLASRSAMNVDGPSWKIVNEDSFRIGNVAKALTVVLPAQGVGEEMIKVRNYGTDPDHPPGYLDFRYSSPTILSLVRSDFLANYHEVPWNLRRLFGWAGSAFPGTSVEQLEFELLYGLSCQIEGIPNNLRISDHFARLGDLPLPPSGHLPWRGTLAQKSDFKAFIDKNRDLLHRISSRLKVIEVWQPATSSGGRPQKLDLVYQGPPDNTDNGDPAGQPNPNFHYFLRMSKKWDGTQFIAFGAQLAYPLFSDENGAALPAPESGSAEEALRQLHPKNGLRGGATWGFESRNIYRQDLWHLNENDLPEPALVTSSSAMIRELSFSTIGGSGHQKAHFANNKMAIESVVSLGRTQFYQVEVIGRIGVFWNRAKHVIIYERVPGRAQQFSPMDPNGEQNASQTQNSGRPILRKVREYVEILQPERAYPDFPGLKDPLSAGFITSCTFKTKIIPVKSSWGQDVNVKDSNGDDRSGWQIPLWQPLADPAIYAKPQIQLEVITDPALVMQPTGQTSDPADQKTGRARMMFTEPQNLYFYTETTLTAGGNTDEWEPFPFIDYPDLPLPEATEPTPTQDDIGQPAPDAEELDPGFQRFTFRVSPGAPSSITSGWVYSPKLIAVVHSVTMLRTPAKAPEKPPTQPPVGPPAPPPLNLINKDWQDGLAKIQDVRKYLNDGYYADVSAIGDAVAKSDKAAATQQLTNLKNNVEAKLSAVNPANWVSPAIDDKKLPTVVDTTVMVPANLFPNSLEVGRALWTKANQAAGQYYDWTCQRIKDELEAPLEGNLIQITAPEQGVDLLDRGMQRLRDRWRVCEGIIDGALNKPQTEISKYLSDFENKFEQTCQFGVSWIDDAEAKIKQDSEDLQDYLTKTIIPQITDVQAVCRRTSDAAEEAVNRVLQLIRQASVTAGFEKIKDTVRTSMVDTSNDLGDLKTALNAVATNKDIVSKLDDTRVNLKRLEQQLVLAVRQQLAQLQANLQAEVSILCQVDKIASLEQEISSLIEDVQKNVDTWKDILTKEGKALSDRVNDAKKQALDYLASLKDLLRQKLAMLLVNDLNNVRPILNPAPVDLDPGKNIYYLIENEIGILLQLGNQKLQDLVKSYDADGLVKDIPAFKALNEILQKGAVDWQQAKDTFNKLQHDVRGATQDLLHATMDEVARLAPLQKTAVNLVQDLEDYGNNSLRLAKSYCESLVAPGLSYSRDLVNLYYQGAKIGQDFKKLMMTPSLANLKDLNTDLQSLGLNLPTNEIDDRIKAMRDELPNFDFGKILANLGGIDFSNLIPNFKMPPIAADHIKVTHGIDQASKRAWVQAEIPDWEMDDELTLFSLGPVTVVLIKPVLNALMRMDANANGQFQKNVKGNLKGDWSVSAGGAPIVTFRDSALDYTNGTINFNIDASKVELSGVLQMISDTMNMAGPLFSDPDSGFTIGLVKQGEIPVGVRAALEMPPFDLAGGTSGVTGLQLGAYFELRALDESLAFNFSLALGLHVSKKEKPFNVMIFILGGGGWVELDVYYLPKTGALKVRLTLGLEASASLALNLGFVRGSVGIYLGVFADYVKSTGEGGSLSIGVMFLMRGEVSVLCIATATMTLLLEAVYQSDNSGSRFYGRGTVDISIRICWCFTLSVHQSVTYTFAGSSSGGSRKSISSSSSTTVSTPKLQDYTNSAKKYLNHLT